MPRDGGGIDAAGLKEAADSGCGPLESGGTITRRRASLDQSAGHRGIAREPLERGGPPGLGNPRTWRRRLQRRTAMLRLREELEQLRRPGAPGAASPVTPPARQTAQPTSPVKQARGETPESGQERLLTTCKSTPLTSGFSSTGNVEAGTRAAPATSNEVVRTASSVPSNAALGIAAQEGIASSATSNAALGTASPSATVLGSAAEGTASVTSDSDSASGTSSSDSDAPLATAAQEVDGEIKGRMTDVVYDLIRLLTVRVGMETCTEAALLNELHAYWNDALESWLDLRVISEEEDGFRIDPNCLL